MFEAMYICVILINPQFHKVFALTQPSLLYSEHDPSGVIVYMSLLKYD